MAELTIATGMCCDTAGEESVYPQVDGVSSSQRFQLVYWRCAVVFFASSVRHNPYARHVLYTNASHIPNIGTFSTAEFLQSLGVEIVLLPFEYAPPAGYYNRWRSTFYLFDIIRHLADTVSDGDRVLVHDTDCLFIKPADALCDAIDRYGVLTYDCKLSPEEDINGLSRLQLGEIYKELGELEMPAPPHFGAEIFAAEADDLRHVAREIEALWEINLSRFADGKPHFNTEEHFLSYIYNKLGYRAGTANPFISRIWTGFHYRTTSESNFDLSVWHVPAEKKYGIRRLFEQARRRDSHFWKVATGDDFARYAASYLGIPASSALKRSLDAFDALKARILATNPS